MIEPWSDNTMQPVSTALNAAVLHMASRVCPTGFDVGPDAPASFVELVAHYNSTHRIKVWDGASDDSIYADREVNWAFRAWHDWAHIRTLGDFTPQGESFACQEQLRGLRRIYGTGSTVGEWSRLIDADCMGQVRYFERWAAFPHPQRPYVVAYANQLSDAGKRAVVELFAPLEAAA